MNLGRLETLEENLRKKLVESNTRSRGRAQFIVDAMTNHVVSEKEISTYYVLLYTLFYCSLPDPYVTFSPKFYQPLNNDPQ